MKDNFEFINFEITNDDNLFEREHGLTPLLKSKLIKVHKKALKGDKSFISKLHKLIEKNPKNPQLKNHLSILYANCNNLEKSFEVNHWIITEHPNYLFGKLNMANEYYIDGKYDKMPEFLGKNMLIQELYPERSVFHFNEVISFLVTSIKYFAAIGDFKQAKMRLEILEELDQEGNHYDDTNRVVTHHLGLAVIDKMKNQEKLRIEVEYKSLNKYFQKTEKVSFIHEEVNLLYTKGFDLKLDNILMLSKETLIKDLENVLIDSMERYDYYEKEIEKNGYTNDNYTFVLHALFLLKELKSTSSLPIVLDVLSQNDDFIELFISYFLTENIWSVIFVLSQNNLDLLTKFMLTEGLDTYAKSAVNDAVIQMYYYNILPKIEVLNWVEHILNKYNNSSIEDNIIDSTLIGFIISDLAEMKGEKLLPIIKNLYDKNYVDVTVYGDYDTILEDIRLDDGIMYLKKNETIFEIYNQMNFNNDFDDSILSNDTDYFENFSPISNSKKISRNDPCYCGSGKKYKKCCINL